MAIPIPSVSEIVKLVKAGATIEAQEKIMELRQAVMDAQDENLHLRDEVQNMKSKIAALEEKLTRREAVVFDQELGLYWFKGEGREHPLCPTCYAKDDKEIHMHTKYSPPGRFVNGYYSWVCNVCNFSFRRPDKPTTPPVQPIHD